MKRKKLIIIIGMLLLIAVTVSAFLLLYKPAFSYEEAEKLIGKGKYEEAYRKLEQDGNFEGADKLKENFIVFPEQETVTDSNGKQTVITKTFSNENNIYKIVTNRDSSEIVKEYLKDEKGNIIKEREIFADGRETNIDYTYDEKGNLIKAFEVTPHNTYVYTYTYDENNFLVGKTISDGVQEGVTYNYTNNEKGKPIKEECIYADKAVGFIEKTYDDKGNKIKEVHTNPDNEVGTIEYAYNEKGKIVSMVTVNPDTTSSTTDYTYDEKGNLIKMEQTYSAGSKYSYEYTYDEKSNRIKTVHTDISGKVTTTEYSGYNYYYIENLYKI